MNDFSRREMLVVAAVCACGSVALGDDKDDKDEKAPPKTLAIGKVSDYSDAKFYDAHRADKVMIRRLDDRLVAMSAICTHKRCVVKIKDESSLRCPCHKGTFSEQGTPISGPPKAALPRYALTQAADGTITVDTTRSFGEKEWDQPEAFVAIKKA